MIGSLRFVGARQIIRNQSAMAMASRMTEELVGRPDGFKHRELRTRSMKEKSEAIRSASDLMARSGTTCFVDFREEGLEGIKLLSASLSPRAPRCVVLGT